MSGPFDTASWFTRGDQLGCFPDRISQARYLMAWTEGDAGHVRASLERVLTRNQRMPALNWLNRPDIMSALDLIEDSPRALPEDWGDADFEITHPSGAILHPSWLDGQRVWDELLASTAREFVFLRSDAKMALAKRWRGQILAALWRRPVPLAELVLLTARADFLTAATAESPTLQALLPERALILVAVANLRERATALHSAWKAVTQPRSDGARLLTMGGLRSCQYVFQIDKLLQECTSERTANLMTYLRCADAPST